MKSTSIHCNLSVTKIIPKRKRNNFLGRSPPLNRLHQLFDHEPGLFLGKDEVTAHSTPEASRQGSFEVDEFPPPTERKQMGTPKWNWERRSRLARESELLEEETSPLLQVYGFGLGRIVWDGREISNWETVKAPELLFYLLTHPAQTKEQIGAVFWPDAGREELKAAFHSTKRRLHRALDWKVIEYSNRGYRLRQDLEYWFDVEEFCCLLRGERGDRLWSLERAIALYTGDFIIGCSGDWHLEQQRWLREMYLEALKELGERLLTVRRYRDALEVFQRGIREDRLQEAFHRGVMRGYALSGEYGLAARQYYRCVEILQDEIRVQPSEKTTDLYQRIVKEGYIE